MERIWLSSSPLLFACICSIPGRLETPEPAEDRQGCLQHPQLFSYFPTGFVYLVFSAASCEHQQDKDIAKGEGEVEKNHLLTPTEAPRKPSWAVSSILSILSSSLGQDTATWGTELGNHPGAAGVRWGQCAGALRSEWSWLWGHVSFPSPTVPVYLTLSLGAIKFLLCCNNQWVQT